MMKKRIIYAIVTAVLVAAEVLIALYVHDSFVRPYLGDMIVVWAVYCAVRVVVPKKCRMLPLYVFLFAACVEVMQLFDLAEVLGLGNKRFFRILLGSVFDAADIVCYAAGCLVLGGHELAVWKRRENRIV